MEIVGDGIYLEVDKCGRPSLRTRGDVDFAAFIRSVPEILPNNPKARVLAGVLRESAREIKTLLQIGGAITRDGEILESGLPEITLRRNPVMAKTLRERVVIYGRSAYFRREFQFTPPWQCLGKSRTLLLLAEGAITSLRWGGKFNPQAYVVRHDGNGVMNDSLIARAVEEFFRSAQIEMGLDSTLVCPISLANGLLVKLSRTDGLDDISNGNGSSAREH